VVVVWPTTWTGKGRVVRQGRPAAASSTAYRVEVSYPIVVTAPEWLSTVDRRDGLVAPVRARKVWAEAPGPGAARLESTPAVPVPGASTSRTAVRSSGTGVPRTVVGSANASPHRFTHTVVPRDPT